MFANAAIDFSTSFDTSRSYFLGRETSFELDPLPLATLLGFVERWHACSRHSEMASQESSAETAGDNGDDEDGGDTRAADPPEAAYFDEGRRQEASHSVRVTLHQV